MIVKERKTPLKILKLQALLRRIPPNHPKIPFLKEELYKRLAGFRGEKSLDYHLSQMDDSSTYILHDIRLKNGKGVFQIDTLILTNRFVLIIEVKNLAGTIYFDSIFNQLIRTKDGQETGFLDPLLQIQRLESSFRNWLMIKGFELLPVTGIVVISSPQTIIKAPEQNSASVIKKVLHAEKLISKYEEINTNYKKCFYDEKQMKKIGRLLNKHHEEENSSILERYNIHRNELLKGVMCPACQEIIEKCHGSWFCGKCHAYFKHAYIDAVNDYYLLIGDRITNKAMRDFLSINSISAATRLLQSLNLKSAGQNKGRVYELSFIEKSTS
ncbi:NERD domain-containing protein [Bacillus sp. FJAT-42376]|uniref:nuclease-related domain-containing protein n=1 Tax=Bacillus sp. FJAT-42376 TaxID=2014076 RepID=UPI000F51102A|nr:nuclease-related domain-containing protein [Bacillus sp. FJAT-42376]AZB44398.1 NERD domain-containing protein [Bacillus sp. FJAT-42376]